ncbi:MarR family transcriptional regulator [Catellatospora sp. TT07R-123]|uniref:MarR family winged helix-turn-helix transcriptional regulator n=1 Tax=Catellatospora sp. TT07R-123 TaxID=2733863 RepID=UPI001B0C5654|nr:MarR family transcriptional regulator [Catellatospora sp. TT07R-123]GHJ48422.1 MarR family transcriptional regulator [Catellatospora sp. TT07R-123]
MAETRWLDADEQETWRAYLEGTRLLIQALDRQLENDSGVSFTDYELLVHLSEAPGRRMRMRDLADATFSSRSGVTRAVTRLEAAGWVRRVECDDDRRGMHAELTATGARKLAETAPGHVAAVRRHMIDLLTADERGRIRDAYSRMRGRLRPGAAAGAAAPAGDGPGAE